MPYIPTMPKNPFIPVVVAAMAILAPFLSLAQQTSTPATPANAPAAAAPADKGAAGAAPATGPAPAPGTAPAAGPAAKAAAPAAPPTEAELFLDEAIKKVAAIETVMADIIERVEMLDQKFEIVGLYRKAPKDRFFLTLEVKNLVDASGKMVQVCDGTTFWEYQQVLETQIYRQLGAGQILAKLRSSDLDQEFNERVLTQLGFGGPDMLLAGLRRIIKFDQKEKGTLDGKPDGPPVWIIRGRWASRDGLLGPNSQPLPPLANLPSYIPSLVSVYLGAEDSWPYRVTLVGQHSSVLSEDTRPIGPDGRRIGPLSSIQRPLLTRIELNYTNVKLKDPVPEKEFIWRPPTGVSPEDRTKELLDALEQAATARAAQKRAEAGSSDDALLNQPIPVPKAEGADAPKAGAADEKDPTPPSSPTVPAQPAAPK